MVIALAVVSAACGSVALASSTGTPGASAVDWPEQGELSGESFQDPPGQTPAAGDIRSSLPAAYRAVAAHTLVLTSAVTARADPLVNGKLRPVLALRPNEAQLWCLIDARPGTSYQVRLPGYRFTVIRQDGVRVAEPGVVDTLTLAPGMRYDVVVTATEPMSRTWLLAIPTGALSKQDQEADTRLVRVDVADAAADDRPVLNGLSPGRVS
ncbi:MAG: hypothetical protein ACJ786_37165 [Catenulispora sp.]